MILNFKRTDVEKLVKHSLESPKHRTLYEQPESAVPGLWLVGDDGIYLMSNGDPGLKLEADMPAETPYFVVYAQECNPKDKSAENDWWAVKREAFGGDDGGELIPYTDPKKECIQEWLDGNPGAEFLQMDLTPQRMKLIGAELLPVQPGKVLEFFKRHKQEPEYHRYFQMGVNVAAFETAIVTMSRKDLIVYIGWLRETKKQLEETVQKQDGLLKRVGDLQLNPTKPVKKKLAKKKATKKRK